MVFLCADRWLLTDKQEWQNYHRLKQNHLSETHLELAIPLFVGKSLIFEMLLMFSKPSPHVRCYKIIFIDANTLLKALSRLK